MSEQDDGYVIDLRTGVTDQRFDVGEHAGHATRADSAASRRPGSPSVPAEVERVHRVPLALGARPATRVYLPECSAAPCTTTTAARGAPGRQPPSAEDVDTVGARRA